MRGILIIVLAWVLVGCAADIAMQADGTATAATRPPLEREIYNVLRSREDVRVNFNPDVPSVIINYRMADNLSSGMMLRGAELDMVALACVLKTDQATAGNIYLFTAEIGLVDSFGNSSIGNGLSVRLLPDAIEQINCENRYGINLQLIAESYIVHPAMR